MLFHSFAFFALFSITFVVYWSLTQHRLRMLWLLGASFAFYGSWNPWLMSVVVFSAAFDFLIAQRIETSPSPNARRALLILRICVSLSIWFRQRNLVENVSRHRRPFSRLLAREVIVPLIAGAKAGIPSTTVLKPETSIKPEIEVRTPPRRRHAARRLAPVMLSI